jgi:hypothetical protein
MGDHKLEQPLRPVNMLWVGGHLGPIERLSLTSFLAHGHPVRLYVYETTSAVPAGVELRDGNEIVPVDVIRANRYANGSYALASNLFRYELQRQSKGIWADCDVVCMRPIGINLPVIVGWESPGHLNGAVLYMDAELPIVAELLAEFRPNHIPDWLPWRKGIKSRLRHLAGMELSPSDLPHGTFGPKAMTALVTRHDQLRFAQPPEVFYPLRPKLAPMIFDASLALEDVVTDNSMTLHLWNEKLGSLKQSVPETGSILATLYDRHGV